MWFYVAPQLECPSLHKTNTTVPIVHPQGSLQVRSGGLHLGETRPGGTGEEGAFSLAASPLPSGHHDLSPLSWYRAWRTGKLPALVSTRPTLACPLPHAHPSHSSWLWARGVGVVWEPGRILVSLTMSLL